MSAQPVPSPAVEAAARVLLHDYESSYSADHLTWHDFEIPAHAVAAAVLATVRPEQVVAAEALEQAAEAIRRAERACKVDRTCHHADALTLEARAAKIREAQP